MKNRLIKNRSRGFAGIIALLTVCVLVLILTFSLSASLFTKKQISRNLSNSLKSYYLAESGTEDAVLRVLKNYTYSPTNTFTLDGSTINQNISKNGNTTTINVSSSYINNVRKLASSLTVTTSNVSFYYGVQIGEGGLTMNGGATVNGNIYSDGSISGNGNITGDAFVATGMQLDSNGDWENYSSDKDFGAKSSSVIDVAMKFVPSASGNLSQISFNVKRTSTAPSSGTVRILKDKAGLPSNLLTDQLSSTIFDVSKIGTSYGWSNYSFSSPANLTAGTTYWIVIDTSASNSVSKYYDIGKSGSNTDISKYSTDWTGGTWTPTGAGNDGGYEYKAWIGGQITSLDGATVGGNAHANTITNSTIAKDAYYQTISGSTVSGALHPGSTDPSVQAMPISDSNIADWENQASAGSTYSDSAHCSPSGDITIGPAVLNCNLSLTSKQILTVSGTLWVKGNITLSGGSVIQLGSGYGTNSGAIIADNPADMANSGKISVSGGATVCGSTGYNSVTKACNASNGSYILMLSTNTSSNAMSLSGGSAGAIFYAAKGTATLSGGADLKEVTAYALNLTGGSSVNYETGLASAAFSSGPGGGWQIDSWNETQ